MTADEMFKKLGYEEKILHKKYNIYKNFISYVYTKECDGFCMYRVIDFELNADTFKAILKKMEELGVVR